MSIGTWLLRHTLSTAAEIALPIAAPFLIWKAVKNWDVAYSWFEKHADQITRVDLLTYREVVDYLVDNKPDYPDIAKGIVYKEAAESGDGFDIYILFLDSKNAIVTDGSNAPCGTKYRVHRIDDELLKTFSGNDIIVFE